MSFELECFNDTIDVRKEIKKCQKIGHIQQVAFSTYHDCLTQICFGCEIIRTSMKKEDLNQTKGGKE